MNDPTELVLVGGTSLTVGGFMMGLLKWSSGRNIAQLDATIKELHTAVQELTKSVQEQREKDIGHEKDVLELKTNCKIIMERVNGLSDYWRNEFDKQRQLNHERVEKATDDLNNAIDALAKVKAAQRRR